MQFIRNKFSPVRRSENNRESHHVQTDLAVAGSRNGAAAQSSTGASDQETATGRQPNTRPDDFSSDADSPVHLPMGIEPGIVNEKKWQGLNELDPDELYPHEIHGEPAAARQSQFESPALSMHARVGSSKDAAENRSEGRQPSFRNSEVEVPSSITNRDSLNISPADPRIDRFENFRRIQENPRSMPTNTTQFPRFPTGDDFAHFISMKICSDEVDDPVERIIIYLHHYGGNEASLEQLARRLRRKLPSSAYILLRGPHSVRLENGGYSWADPQGHKAASGQEYKLLFDTSRLLLEHITDGLISRCKFKPKNIMILGHRQGGSAALATVASWNEEKFGVGGVISIGGPLPEDFPLPSAPKAKTSALVLLAANRDMKSRSLRGIKKTFEVVDVETRSGAHDTIPEAEELKAISDFFAHRFDREEWERQAIVSFDGGGIRGLGSLLILRELMNKIGDEEKRADREDGCAESSFAPCIYKPTNTKRVLTDNTEDSKSTENSIGTAAPLDGLPNSSLFLPCHYFTYAAGTSTGGLISIMLSRFRMTVDDCIKEYKTLGERIFGHPRPLAKGAILWHKFNAEKLEEVIKEVTKRHSEASDFEPLFPSAEDLCRTLVFAYADHLKSDVPYFFRTYFSHRPALDPKRTMSRQGTWRNYGEPPKLPIWQVARATSAAPGYFRPISIPKGNGHGTQEHTKFKDGGFGTNNPSRETYYDIVNKHGGHSKSIGIFVSIGTGETPLKKFAQGSGHLRNFLVNLNAAIKLPSRTHGAHEDMEHLAFHDGKDIFAYYRFNGGEELGKIALDEWKSHHFTQLTSQNDERGCKTVKKIDDSIATYLKQTDVQRELIACAKLLVRRRRLRTRDAFQWDRYASASYYVCDFKGCEKKRIKTGHLYKEHTQNEHRIPVVDQEGEKKMRHSRRCWIYPNQSATPSASGRDIVNTRDPSTETDTGP